MFFDPGEQCHLQLIDERLAALVRAEAGEIDNGNTGLSLRVVTKKNLWIERRAQR
jgi:hypothetical protein